VKMKREIFSEEVTVDSGEGIRAWTETEME
jgi:hypothetical protein